MFGKVGAYLDAFQLQLSTNIQIASWWSSTPTAAAEKAPYNPSDPKQNPLNPKGLKPCVNSPIHYSSIGLQSSL